MTILDKIPYSLMIGGVFVDALTVTMPSAEADRFRDTFADFLSTMSPDVCQYLELRGAAGYQLFAAGDVLAHDPPKRFILFSTVAAGRCFKVEAKGAFLDMLRRLGVYDHFLAAISLYPHKVTRLDVTADFDYPAPGYVHRLMAAAQTGELAFTRKSIQPQKCKMMQSVNTANVLTGCVYLGQGADVSAKVYDKQAERWDKAGLVIPPRTRVEISLNRGAGATLRDASLPRVAFEHFAGKFLVSCPSVDWVSHALPCVLTHAPPVDLTVKIERHVAASMDLHRLLSLLAQHNQNADTALAHLRLLVRPALESILKARELASAA